MGGGEATIEGAHWVGKDQNTPQWLGGCIGVF